MNPDNDHQATNKKVSMISFSLAAAGFATIIQLTTLPHLDYALTVTVYCFAASIPLHITAGLVFQSSPTDGLTTLTLEALISIINFSGLFLSVVAISGMFFHFGKPAGATYLASTIICILVSRLLKSSN